MLVGGWCWIITGGTQTGVRQFVGQAVRDYMLQSGNYEQKLVVIGIADLGHIANSEVIKNGSFSIHIAESEVVLITSAKEVMYSSSFVCERDRLLKKLLVNFLYEFFG